MGSGVRPIDLSDADLYEHLRDRGLTHDQAVLHVERRRRAANQPSENPGPQGPTKAEAALAGATQGATAGLADEILGSIIAAHGDRWNPPGQSFGQNREQATATMRGQINDARLAHPVAALGGQVVGSFVNPLNRLLGPVTKGMTPTQTGATYGAVLGGAQGAGEASGGIKDRLLGLLAGGTVGGVTGAAFGYATGKAGGYFSRLGPNLRQGWRSLRNIFAKTEQAVARDLPKGAAPEVVQDAQEAAHRAYLQKQGFPQEAIDQLMTTWRNGNGKLPTRPPTVETPVATRPGESVTTQEPSLDSPAYMRAGNPRNLPPVRGRGPTLPYYPRGGQAQQATAPLPVTSSVPKGAEGQVQVFVDYLKGAPPAEIPERLSTLRALGVQLDAQTEQQLLNLLRTPR